MSDTIEPDMGVDDIIDDGVIHTFWHDGWRILKGRWQFWLAAVFIGSFILMAVWPNFFLWFAPGPNDPSGAFCVLREARMGSSSEHWFGTDSQGCDYYTQVTYGARVSMRVAVGATVITLIIGILLGSLAGYYGGLIDTVISRLADGFLSLPYLVGAVLILAALTSQEGRSEWDVMFAIGALGWPGVVRLYRSTVLQVRNLEYVHAARALGASDARIMFTHILPNALTPVLVVSTVNMAVVIAVESTLTFFGIGLPLDSISWGQMIAEATNRMSENPHLLLFPTAYLLIISLGFVLLGEQLREAFDPRLR